MIRVISSEEVKSALWVFQAASLYIEKCRRDSMAGYKLYKPSLKMTAKLTRQERVIETERSMTQVSEAGQ